MRGAWLEPVGGEGGAGSGRGGRDRGRKRSETGGLGGTFRPGFALVERYVSLRFRFG